MAAFKDGMLHAYATSRDAFAALDASLLDLDAALDEEPLDLKEFVRGTKNFKPPLTKEQATYAFRGLDTNEDGLLQEDEFVDGIRSGGFFRVTTTTTGRGDGSRANGDAPITMAEFKSGMLKAYPSAPDAFAALDASETDLSAALDENPINLEQFIHGTSLFDPPLTNEQAKYAFHGLDADEDGMLVSSEFVEGLNRGQFIMASTSTILQSTTATTTTLTSTTTRSTSTTTTSSSTTTTTSTIWHLPPRTGSGGPAGAGDGQGKGPEVITMADFKSRMLKAHASALKAFQTLDANPAALEDFIRGTKTFEPPLTKEQAVYAFRGLDADHDNVLPSFEFFEVLECGRFFPTLRDLVVMGSPRLRAQKETTTTTTPAPSAGVDLAKVVLLVTACPLLCLFVPCARVALRHLYRNKRDPLETYKVVGPREGGPGRSAALQSDGQFPRAKRSRLLGSGGLLSCCIRSTDDAEEPPLLCPSCSIDEPRHRLH